MGPIYLRPGQERRVTEKKKFGDVSVDIFFWKPVSVGDDSSQRLEKSGMGVESFNEAADGDAGV